MLFVLLESAAKLVLLGFRKFDEASAAEATVQKQISKPEISSKIAYLKVSFPLTQLPSLPTTHSRWGHRGTDQLSQQQLTPRQEEGEGAFRCHRQQTARSHLGDLG